MFAIIARRFEAAQSGHVMRYDRINGLLFVQFAGDTF